jgi:SAM-dependent methyltransferase
MSDYFAKKAATWDAVPAREAMAEAFVNELAGQGLLTPATDALEFGAGTGLAGLRVAGRVRSLAMLDTSPAMLGKLTEKLAPLRLPQASVHHFDLTAAPWSGAAPDLVFSLMALHHVPEPKAAIAAFAATLKPGGTAVIADLLPEDGSFHGAEPAFHNGFEPAVAIAWFRQAGFARASAHTFHTLAKPGPDGVMRDYGLFLLSAHKK